MKIAVVGLWHLGCVTAACLSSAGHDVIAYDSDKGTIDQLQNGLPPIFEPRLTDLLIRGKNSNTLNFSSHTDDLTNADIVWVTFDTPVDDNDIAQVDTVKDSIIALYPFLKKNALVLISSQLPVGSTRQLQQECTQRFPEKNISFAYSPENLRLGKAIDIFTKPDRIIVGLASENDKTIIQSLLSPFTTSIIWMSIESAEMTKHALNAFLATSVVFINELATLCEKTGANAREVEQGLKSEERIGTKAYLRPGTAIAGGTLARDVNYLTRIGQQHNTQTPLFSSLLESNESHKKWSCQRVMDIFKDIKNKTITTLGLTYKVDTDTLRRSTAVESCLWLQKQGAKILAYDPGLKELPAELSSYIELKNTLSEALQGSDAILVSTESPAFNTLTADQVLTATNNAFNFDPGGFLAKNLSNDSRLRYFTVGSQA